MALAEEREATALVNAWLYVALADGDLDEAEQEVLDQRIAQLYPVLPDGAFARMFGKAIVTVATSTTEELLEFLEPDDSGDAERLLTNLILLVARSGGIDDDERARFLRVAGACGHDPDAARSLMARVARAHDLHPETLAPQTLRT